MPFSKVPAPTTSTIHIDTSQPMYRMRNLVRYHQERVRTCQIENLTQLEKYHKAVLSEIRRQFGSFKVIFEGGDE